MLYRGSRTFRQSDSVHEASAMTGISFTVNMGVPDMPPEETYTKALDIRP